MTKNYILNNGAQLGIEFGSHFTNYGTSMPHTNVHCSLYAHLQSSFFATQAFTHNWGYGKQKDITTEFTISLCRQPFYKSNCVKRHRWILLEESFNVCMPLLIATRTFRLGFHIAVVSEWHQLGHMQVCTSLQADNHASTPPLKFFTGRMPFQSPNRQRQSTEGVILTPKYTYW